MNAKKFEAWLCAHRACVEGRLWAHGKSMCEVWKTCERADWMMWLYRRRKPDKKKCVQIAVFSARQVLPLFEERHPNDKRPQQAIEAAEAWINNPSKENAYAAAAAYASAAYAYASDADADAYASADAAAASASAASAASAYASAYASAAAKRKTHEAICAYIRKLIPTIK